MQVHYAAAGGVGTAVAQPAKPAGVMCIGLTSTDEKARHAKDQGMERVINYKRGNIWKIFHISTLLAYHNDLTSHIMWISIAILIHIIEV